MPSSSRHRVPWTLRLVASAAMAVLALAACGGSDDSADGVAIAADEQPTVPATDSPTDGTAETDADDGSGGDVSDGVTSTTAPDPTAVSAPTVPPAVDDDRPRLDPAVLSGTVNAVDGSAFDLGDLAGTDLVVWFWAPW